MKNEVYLWPVLNEVGIVVSIYDTEDAAYEAAARANKETDSEDYFVGEFVVLNQYFLLDEEA